MITEIPKGGVGEKIFLEKDKGDLKLDEDHGQDLARSSARGEDLTTRGCIIGQDGLMSPLSNTTCRVEVTVP